MTDGALPSRRKAAALVLALGAGSSASLLEHLSEEEVRQLATEVAEMKELAEDARFTVFRETLEGASKPRRLGGGIDVAKQLLAGYKGSDGALMLDDGGPAVFDFVGNMPAMRVAQLLKDEHPQVVALVLSDQDAQVAASVLSQLPPDTRKELAYRIATTRLVGRPVLDRLREVLLHRGGSHAVPAGLRPSRDGAKGLAEILNAAGRESEDEILEYVDGVDGEVADRVRALMFVFEDIGDLDDRTIQAVLKSVDTGTLSYALKGVGDRTRDAITRNLSERARQSLLEEMDLMGPVRRSEVEEAQQKCISELRALEESGEIVLGRAGGDEFVS